MNPNPKYSNMIQYLGIPSAQSEYGKISLGMSLPPLPSELWLEIFRFATTTPNLIFLHATTYHPFQVVPPDKSYKYPKTEFSFRVKAAISLVCRRWNELARDLLYEDIVIPEVPRIGDMKHQLIGNEANHSIDIEDDTDASRPRYRVQRILLPFTSTTTRVKTTNISDVNAIIQHYSSTLIALYRPNFSINYVRGRMIIYEFPAGDCPPLPSLKRLDWWHSDEASRTGGINSLTHVLRVSPNIQYLSLGGHSASMFMEDGAVALPDLTTLRLQTMSMTFMFHLHKWHLPSLRNLVLDNIRLTYTFSIMEGFWDVFGAQLRTVEFGRYLTYLLDPTTIQRILNGCPNLEEFSYYSKFTLKPLPPDEPHMSLAVVRMNLEDLEMQMENSLESHLIAWCAYGYPNLRRILLYGSEDLESGSVGEAVKKLRTRGCEVSLIP